MPCIQKLTTIAGAGAILLCAAAVSAAGPQEDSGVAIYADLCFHAESGDLLGDRVVVMRFKEADYVLFQSAQGEIGMPRLGSAKIDARSGDIVFRITEADQAVATFKGKMTDRVLTGSFDNQWTNRLGEKTLQLPRLAGRQRSFPECR